MASYLVTGGCGFIGSHLSEALLQRGDTVRILDDLSSGLADNLPSGSELWQGSVWDSEFVKAAMTDMSGCFHLAAVASVERSTRDWFGTHRTNLSGTIAVFNAAVEVTRKSPHLGAIPVVYASSAAVYGDCKELPIRESTLPRPLSPYAADKWGSEVHARLAGELYGVPTVGLRFFNVYGPRQDPTSPYSGVISIFCERLLQRQPIEIFGDGTQTRDFVFVRDVVAAMLASMQQAQRQPTPSSEIYNVCTGNQTSVLELAGLVGELCGRKPKILFRPRRDGEVAYSCGDPSLMHDALGLNGPTDLTAGLSVTLSWMRGD